MGSFCTQVLVCGSTQEACADIMRELGRRSIVVRPHRGIVPVCDQRTESQELDELDSLAASLSSRLQVPAVAVLNHDDDVLLRRVFGPEGLRGYCQSGIVAGGAYKALKEACAARCSVLALRFAFARPTLFEADRHERLARLLDLPPWSVGLGYTYLARGEFDSLIPEGERIRT